MSLSGISMDQDLIEKYEDMRLASGAKLVLKIENENLVLEKEGGDLNALIQNLPDAEPRYVIYDIPVKNRANLDDMRTVFLMYMPMESPVRMRMMYSSTKSVITTNFRGLSLNLQIDTKEEVTLESIQDKIKRTQGINNP